MAAPTRTHSPCGSSKRRMWSPFLDRRLAGAGKAACDCPMARSMLMPSPRRSAGSQRSWVHALLRGCLLLRTTDVSTVSGLPSPGKTTDDRDRRLETGRGIESIVREWHSPSSCSPSSWAAVRRMRRLRARPVWTAHAPERMTRQSSRSSNSIPRWTPLCPPMRHSRPSAIASV